MGSAASCVELAGLAKTQRAVHCMPDICGVVVFLTIVFPPAHWA